ncbi:GNAT family N-acetyltransferase [filamentous cyanobacterium LEGE 11480]|uniref:GNAT family N-acetyltransferase n=1 Tax=Romeriopsis navalis LEGE 11480 TaxID=2777977 RepID=A0A928VRS7_9CYAN|nr:GNAT family N-acetyltransferase [Romeriopsis navalis]MBE9032588.1 GNAT family N-acetyltransferase [Romeriopsis navalis LEGE 11480]
MPRLVPPQCLIRPSQIQDLKQLAQLDRAWEESLAPNHTKHWRNAAAIAFAIFILSVSLKDLKLLGLILLGFTPLYLIFGWVYWLSQNPLAQDWINYWVIECNGKIIAAAKWEHYESYSELQQLYVQPKWRFNRLGSSLIERLISQTPQPIYVISDRNHSRYFARFGFTPVDWDNLPKNFPVPDFAVPGVERSADNQIPMVLNPAPTVQRRLEGSSNRPVQVWSGIQAKIYNRPYEE